MPTLKHYVDTVNNLFYGPLMKLSEFLEKSGVSVDEFAGKIGVTRQAVHLYLTDQRVPRKSVMAKIAKATKDQVMANDFMGA